MNRKRILIVCRWPVGGIRTYLKYNYRYFDPAEWDVTLLAMRTIEAEIVERDMSELGVTVKWAEPLMNRNVLFWRTAQELKAKKYDLVHSQGFLSGYHAALVAPRHNVPNVLTIHGILEEKYFAGALAPIKRAMFGWAMKRVDVFHGVSQDMLDHLDEEFPSLRSKGARWEVINNGINPEPFLKDYPEAREMLHGRYDIDNRRFVFGFFGRFMPQKGFNYIIDAVENLSKTAAPGSFVVLAVSSGDYEREYKREVTERGLDDWFHFGSFSPDVALLIQGCDAVLMPSIWEAWGLLACEVLCAGTPLIASTCIGMRGVIADTPALAIPPHDPDALTTAMGDVMSNGISGEVCQNYRSIAAERFHVRHTGSKLAELFSEICNKNENR